MPTKPKKCRSTKTAADSTSPKPSSPTRECLGESKKENTPPPPPPPPCAPPVRTSVIMPLPFPAVTYHMTFAALTRLDNFYRFKNIMQQRHVPLDQYFGTSLRALAIKKKGPTPEPPFADTFIPDIYDEYTYLDIYGHFNLRHITQVLKNYFKAFVQCKTCTGCTTLVVMKKGQLCLTCLACQGQYPVTKRSGIA